jgi:glycerol-3-phosphate cytidylyltransferase
MIDFIQTLPQTSSLPGTLTVTNPKVGLLAGAFDLIHPGYIKLLKDAKRVCDYLIIALQDDPSIDRPKTKQKPIFSKEERADILMSIRYVDEVRFYQTEADLQLLLIEIKPDIRILGIDYLRDGVKITGKGLAPLYYHHRDYKWSTSIVRQMIKEAK